MFMARRLGYLHLPRTGGSFVDAILRANVRGERNLVRDDGTAIHGHGGVRDLTPTRINRSFLFATLRDPWSFYSSLDAHFVRGYGEVFLASYLGGKRPFSEVLTALTAPELAGVNMNESVRIPGMGPPIPQFGRMLSDAGIGLYTWWALRMFCRETVEEDSDVSARLNGSDVPWSIDCVVDTAHLRIGLTGVLSSWDADVGARVASIIEEHPVTNKSRSKGGSRATGGPDPLVYTPRMQEHVARADGWLIRRFGFERPVAERPAAVLLPKQPVR